MEQITNRINHFMQIPTTPQRAFSTHEERHRNTLSNAKNQTLLPDVVDISQEGKNRGATEKVENPLWQSLHKLATHQKDEAQAVQTDPKDGSIDAAIKELEKKIRELQERMEPLRENKDEASQELLEQLESELMTLNIQLMELNNRKLEQLKAKKA